MDQMSRKGVIAFTYVSTIPSFGSNFALTGLLWGFSKFHKSQEEVIFREGSGHMGSSTLSSEEVLDFNW